MLNDIPPKERGWRRSSIASRLRILAALAGDPAQNKPPWRSVGVRGVRDGAFETVTYFRKPGEIPGAPYPVRSLEANGARRFVRLSLHRSGEAAPLLSRH